MSDIFHEAVDDQTVLSIFETMNKANWHTFQVLTKRSNRLVELSDRINWTPNIWMGVSVEDRNAIYRIDQLKQCGAAVKFISAEPLLESIPSIDLVGIDWLIVGGESGAHCRPMEAAWVRDLRDRAKEQNVAFFFKQWGGFHHGEHGSELDGKLYKEYPKNQKD